MKPLCIFLDEEQAIFLLVPPVSYSTCIGNVTFGIRWSVLTMVYVEWNDVNVDFLQDMQ